MKQGKWWICSSEADLHEYILDLKGDTDKDYYCRYVRFNEAFAKQLMPIFVEWDKSRNRRFKELGMTMLKALTGNWHGLALLSFKSIFSKENDEIVKNESAKIGIAGQLYEDLIYFLKFGYQFEVANQEKNEIVFCMRDTSTV